MNLSLDAEDLPKAVRDFQPEWGLVLGSGLGSLVDEVDAILSVPYEEIAGLPVSTVPGHAGRFVFGRLAGRRVIVAQGRVHLYEGRTAEETTAGVRFMAALGVKKLILTNAAGSLRADFAPGTWMMLSDHLNLTGTSPLLGGVNFVDMSAVYSADLRAHFARLEDETPRMTRHRRDRQARDFLIRHAQNRIHFVHQRAEPRAQHDAPLRLKIAHRFRQNFGDEGKVHAHGSFGNGGGCGFNGGRNHNHQRIDTGQVRTRKIWARQPLFPRCSASRQTH